jgi:hypothetical protein
MQKIVPEMIDNLNFQQKLACILRDVGNKACTDQAEMVEHATAPLTSLHFRSLGLESSDTVRIAEALQLDGDSVYHAIQSLSLSYNNNLGDKGATALAKHLPHSLREIGLVDCGIGDIGGLALLEWIKKCPYLRMVCIEQNNFSIELRSKFRLFSDGVNHLTLIV